MGRLDLPDKFRDEDHFCDHAETYKDLYGNTRCKYCKAVLEHNERTYVRHNAG